MDYQSILQEIGEEVKPLLGQGRVANYIPALSRVSPQHFGMAVKLISGEEFTYGDGEKKFSIQSISKLFTLTLALKRLGDDLWKKINREPSGNAFNSLIQLEYEEGIPRNPFINAGAHVITDIILSDNEYDIRHAKNNILEFIHLNCCHTDVGFDEEVANSEDDYGFRNRAMANFLRSFDRVSSEVNDLLHVYFHQCSITMSCLDLCKSVGYLANGGVSPSTQERVVSTAQAKRINSLLLTCGLYDAVGDFAYRVGLPAKSGVGGGIVGVVPNVLSVCVWSPGLDQSGNSLAGFKALELFTTKTGLSIF